MISALTRRFLGGKRFDRVSVNLTWPCPLGDSERQCPYCWVKHAVRSDANLYGLPDRPAEDWQEVFHRLDPAILDFVGGEPFLYEGFVRLIRDLPNKHRYAPTSNLHCDAIFQFARECDPKRCVSFTASFHFTGLLSKEEFADRLEVLRGSGFPVSVNLVNYPPFRDRILDIYEFFQQRRFATHISPYERIDEVRSDFDGLFVCSCGINRYIISNNGDAYRCFSWFKRPDRKRAYMGNLFDGTFRKYEEEKLCDIRCEPYLVYDPTDGMVPDMRIRVVKPWLK